MSSHHFVREGQEPALFILEATNYSDAEGLLEWAPMVIVAEAALQEVLLWGIKIDVVIAGQDTIEELTAKLADQAPIRILAAGNEPVETVLLFLTNLGQPAVSIMTETFPESLREKIEGLPSKLQVTVKTKEQKWAFIPSGHFKKWYQAGALIDFSDAKLAIRIKAVSSQKNGFELIEDQWVSIESSKPFWIAEFS